MLNNMHSPPAEGNDDNANTLKPAIIKDYKRQMGYMDKGERMTNSYTIRCRTRKRTKTIFPPTGPKISFLLQWKRDFSQRISSVFSKGYANTSMKSAMTMKKAWKASKCYH
jgi:hypothetical protein